MTYFKIDDVDFSNCVNSLKVTNDKKYVSQTNAAGNTVVDFINTKRSIDVGIIPLNNEQMIRLMNKINKFNVSISFLNPNTGALETINCIIPSSGVEYYTIQAGKTLYKTFKLKITEL
jgi:hypothetical protein